MPNYVRLRDFAAVMAAGNALTSAGADLFASVKTYAGPGGAITQGELHALRGHDDYANDFRGKVYTAHNRNTLLRDGSMNVASHANQIGPAVLTAVREVLWVDAVNGAAMLRNASGSP